jgi:hypothetical protein
VVRLGSANFGSFRRLRAEYEPKFQEEPIWTFMSTAAPYPIRVARSTRIPCPNDRRRVCERRPEASMSSVGQLVVAVLINLLSTRVELFCGEGAECAVSWGIRLPSARSWSWAGLLYPGYGCLTVADRDVAQLGSAPRLGRGGRRFKSCRPDNRTLV